MTDVGDGSWLGRELAKDTTVDIPEDTTVDIPEDSTVDEADTWDDVGCAVKGDCLIAALSFLPTKSISFTGAYWTSLTQVGIIQYDFFCVTVMESRMRTPLSMANRSNMRAGLTKASYTTQGVRGFSLIL